MKIIVKDGIKKYDNISVLNGIKQEFESGVITSIVAPNGVGKTTLLSVISGLIQQDSGEVIYDGLKKEDINIVLAGDKNLYLKNTVMENLYYFAAIQGMAKKAMLIEVNRIKGLYPDFDSLKDTVVERLSYGQKRLIAIFISLVLDNKCIIIDEAAEGLDMDYCNQLCDFLELYKKDKIIILASHDYDFVSRISDKIIFLKDGIISNSYDSLDSDQVKEEYMDVFNVGSAKDSHQFIK